MEILDKVKAADTRTIALVRTTVRSGGRRWGQWNVLRIVALPPNMSVEQYRSISQKGVELLAESAEVDARYYGRRSAYFKALERIRASFKRVASEIS